MSFWQARAIGFASWWTQTYTRTAPIADAIDRRAEVESDVYEQLAVARGRDRRTTWAMASRVVRGMPADIAWRLAVERAPGRLRWHLAHPATVFGSSFLLLLPLGLAADLSREYELAWSAFVTWMTNALAAGIVAFGVVSMAGRRVSWGFLRWDLRGWRVFALCSMSFLGAVSAVWRLAPLPLEAVAALAWAGFGLALIGYATTVVAGLARHTREIDFRKVSS
jgi:hypothetical protein